MPWEPEPDTVIRIAWTSSAIGFAIAIVALLGELLDWWNDLGEVALTVGTILGLLAGFGGLFFTSGRRQVNAIGEGVASVGEGVASVHRAVLDNGVKLDKLDKLDVIEHALVAEDGQTSKLDVLQVELDRQTGVLDRQVGILTQIRDRL